MDPEIADVLKRIGGGVFVSALAQAAYYKVNRPDVLERNSRVLESIELLLDAEPKPPAPEMPRSKLAQITRQVFGTTPPEPKGPPLDKNSVQYGQNIIEVRAYFLTQDVPLKASFPEHVAAQWRKVKGYGLNSLGKWPTWAFGTAVELGWDTLLNSRAYAEVFKETAAGSLWRNIYQIPAFVGGMYLGRGITAVFRGEERGQERKIRKLMQSTNIIDIVADYRPREEVREELQQTGVRDYTRRFAAGVAMQAKLLTGRFGERGETRRNKEDEALTALRKRFQENLKNY